MATAASKALVNTDTCIFYPVPERLAVDQTKKTIATRMKIEAVMDMLRQQGPFVAFGTMGPTSYEWRSYELDEKIGGQRIFTYPAESPRHQFHSEDMTHVFVVGAKISDAKKENDTSTQGYVYYRPSRDNTRDEKAPIREHIPVGADAIYRCSHSENNNEIEEIYPHF